MPPYAVRHQAAAPRSASEASQESSPHTPCEEPPPSTRPRAAWTGFANLAKPRLSGLHYSQRLHTARTQARAAPNKPTPHSVPSAANPCAAAPPAKPTVNSGAAPPTPTAKAPKTSKPRPTPHPPPPTTPPHNRPVRKVRPVRRPAFQKPPPPGHPPGPSDAPSSQRHLFLHPSRSNRKERLVGNTAFHISLSLHHTLLHLQTLMANLLV